MLLELGEMLLPTKKQAPKAPVFRWGIQLLHMCPFNEILDRQTGPVSRSVFLPYLISLFSLKV